MSTTFPNQNETTSLTSDLQAVQIKQEQSLNAPPAHVHVKKNIYPTARHMLLIACVLLTLCMIVFLIHQNGKSIYDKGL